MKIEKLIKEGIVKLEMYNSVSEHTAEYGLDAKNPLFIKHLSIAESHRLKGIGNKVLKYLDDYAKKNKNDIIFGHIPNDSVFTQDSRQTYLSDVDMIKYWLHHKGYSIQEDNNDFHKVIKSDSDEFGGKGYSDKIAESQENLRSIITGLMCIEEDLKKHINKENLTPLIKADVNDVEIVISKATEEERVRLIKYIVNIIKTETSEILKESFDLLEEIKAYNYLDDSIVYINKIELIKEKNVTTIFSYMQMVEFNYFKENKEKKLSCIDFKPFTWILKGDDFKDISENDIIDDL